MQNLAPQAIYLYSSIANRSRIAGPYLMNKLGAGARTRHNSAYKLHPQPYPKLPNNAGEKTGVTPPTKDRKTAPAAIADAAYYSQEISTCRTRFASGHGVEAYLRKRIDVIVLYRAEDNHLPQTKQKRARNARQPVNAIFDCPREPDHTDR